MKTALTEINTAAVENLPYTGLTVAISSLDRGGPDSNSRCSLLLNAENVSWEPSADGNSYTASLLVGSATFSAKKRVLSYNAQLFTLTLTTAQHNELAKIQPSFAVEIGLPAAATTLRFVVRDQGSGRLGSAEMRPIPAM